MRSACSPFRRTRTAAPPISPSSIFAFQTAVSWYGPGAGFLSLSFRFRTRRWQRYTTRTGDRRIVWRALAEEFEDSCAKRGGLEPLSSSIRREPLPPPLPPRGYPEGSSGGARRPREPTTLVSSRGRPLVALGFGQRPRDVSPCTPRKDARVSLRWREPLKDPQGRRSRESTDGRRNGPQERSEFSEAKGSRRPPSDTSPG